MPRVPSTTAKPEIGKTRFVIGAALFIIGFLCPLLVPLVTGSNLSSGWKTFLTTALVAGLPEVGMLAAIAVLGKEGFSELKQKLFSLFRKHTDVATVTPARYRLGLAMFCIPLLIGFIHPYLATTWPELQFPSITPVIILDLIFVASLLVLGAGFWEKFRALFSHD